MSGQGEVFGQEPVCRLALASRNGGGPQRNLRPFRWRRVDFQYLRGPARPGDRGTQMVRGRPAARVDKDEAPRRLPLRSGAGPSLRPSRSLFATNSLAPGARGQRRRCRCRCTHSPQQVFTLMLAPSTRTMCVRACVRARSSLPALGACVCACVRVHCPGPAWPCALPRCRRVLFRLTKPRGARRGCYMA